MIREILIVEDRNSERDAYERIAKQYGETFAVANLADAIAFLTKYKPSIVISDLHLHDGNSPLEVATQIYQHTDLHQGRLYFMTTDLGDTALTSEIRAHFRSIKIIEKSHVNLERLFADFRHTESGRLVESMDMDTASSRDSIRRIVNEVIDEILADLNLTRFEVKVWVLDRLRCKSRREKLAWSIGVLILGALALALYNFAETAFIEALKRGLD